MSFVDLFSPKSEEHLHHLDQARSTPTNKNLIDFMKRFKKIDINTTFHDPDTNISANLNTGQQRWETAMGRSYIHSQQRFAQVDVFLPTADQNGLSYHCQFRWDNTYFSKNQLGIVTSFQNHWGEMTSLRRRFKTNGNNSTQLSLESYENFDDPSTQIKYYTPLAHLELAQDESLIAQAFMVAYQAFGRQSKQSTLDFTTIHLPNTPVGIVQRFLDKT